MTRQSMKRVGALVLALVLVFTSALVLMPVKRAKAVDYPTLTVWNNFDITVDYSKLSITSGMTPKDLAKQMKEACSASSNPAITELGNRLGLGFLEEGDEEPFELTFENIISFDDESFSTPIKDSTRIKFEVIGLSSSEQKHPGENPSLVDKAGNDKFPVFKINGNVVEPEKHRGTDNHGSDAWIAAVSSTKLLSIEYYRWNVHDGDNLVEGVYDGTVEYFYVDLGTFAQFKQTVASNGGAVEGVTTNGSANVSSGGVTVDTAKLKADNANTEVKDGSAAEKAGLTVNQVIDKLASSDNKDLIKSAVDLGSLKVDVTVENKDKLDAKIAGTDPETLLAVLAPQYLVNGITGNDKVVVDLTVKVTDAKNVDTKVKTAVNKVKTNAEQLYYFDADMTLFVNNNKVGALTEFGSPISITVGIPTAIKANNRAYRMILTHESAGTVTTAVLEDQDKDPNTFTMSTDKLCTVAFAYKAANYKGPKTGDSNLPFSVAMISLASLILVLGVKKRNLSD